MSNTSSSGDMPGWTVRRSGHRHFWMFEGGDPRGTGNVGSVPGTDCVRELLVHKLVQKTR